MRRWALIGLLCACTAQGQLLDIGDGKHIVVTKQGAYVPNDWIDTAVDSAQVWRKSDAHFKIALLRVSSLAREAAATGAQRDSLAAKLGRTQFLADTCQSQLEEVDLHLQDCTEENARMKPWATFGKVTVGVAVAVLVIRGTQAAINP